MAATPTPDEIAVAVAEGLAPVIAALEKLTARLDAVLAPMEAKLAAAAEDATLAADAIKYLDAINVSAKARAWFTSHATSRERLALLIQLKPERLESCALRGAEYDARYLDFAIRLDAAIEWERQHPQIVRARELERGSRKRKRNG